VGSYIAAGRLRRPIERPPTFVIFVAFVSFYVAGRCQAPSPCSILTRVRARLGPWPSARLLSGLARQRAAPRDCAVSVRTRERRYLLRGGRLLARPSANRTRRAR